MLTTAAPAFNRAAQGQLNPQLAAALSRALFNCSQPLEHRGPAAFSNGNLPQRGGVLTQQGWRPSDYPDLFPDQAGFVDAPAAGGYRAGDWYSTFYGSPYFDLRSELQQNLNQYYSGPTVTIEGDTTIQNLTTDNHVVNNLTVSTINGQPANGGDGPAGQQGQRSLGGTLYVIPVFAGVAPPPPADGVGNRLVRLEGLVNGVIDAIRRLERKVSRLRIVGWPQGQEVLVGATFEEDTCTVNEEKKPLVLRIVSTG